MLESFRHEFKAGTVLNSSISGLLVGLVALVNAVTYGVTVFNPTGAPSVGIQMALVSGLVLSISFGLFGSLSGMVALPQAAVVPVLAALVLRIVEQMKGQPAGVVMATVLAAVTLASVVMGVACLFLGFKRWGVIIRYMPYPVSGGFLAGLGWLLLKNGYFASLAGAFPTQSGFCAQECVAFWGPAAAVGLILFIVQQNKSWSWLTSVVVVLAVGVFYVVELFVLGVPFSDLRQAGWLLELADTGRRGIDLFQFPLLTAYTKIDWSVLLTEGFASLTVLFTALIGLLMNINGIERSVNEDVDPNREMVLSGLANLASVGIGGGIVGYPAAALTTMAYQRGRPGRLANVFVSGLFALALFYGLGYVSYLPRFVLGGLLISMGVNFIFEWLIQGVLRFTFADYLVVLVMFVTVAYQDLLYGVVLGVLLTGLIFVIRYSQTHVIRTTLTGESFQSNVDRPMKHVHFLKEHGRELLILRLQGFIFFGTAYSIYGHVRTQLEQNATEPKSVTVKYLVLDFRQTTGVDSSAALVFNKMVQLAEKNKFELVLCSLSEDVQKKLARNGFSLSGRHVYIYESLDGATEWCEDRMLNASDHTIATGSALINNIGEFFTHEEINRLLGFMQKLEVQDNHALFTQGQENHALYLIERGHVTIYREGADGQRVRLRRMGAGAVVGEMGLYMGGQASATVLTDIPSRVYILTDADLKKMEEEAPALADTFHRYIIQLLGQRLQNTNASVTALLN